MLFDWMVKQDWRTLKESSRSPLGVNRLSWRSRLTSSEWAPHNAMSAMEGVPASGATADGRRAVRRPLVGEPARGAACRCSIPRFCCWYSRFARVRLSRRISREARLLFTDWMSGPHPVPHFIGYMIFIVIVPPYVTECRLLINCAIYNYLSVTYSIHCHLYDI